MSGNAARRRSRKIGAVRGIRVPRGWQQHPQERNAHAVPGHQDQQYVDRGLAEIPVRAINRQNPRLAGKAEQLDHYTRRVRTVEPHKLEEPIKPPLHRSRLRRTRHVGRQPPQADHSVLHDQQRQPRQRLPPCRRQTDVFGYRHG